MRWVAGLALATLASTSAPAQERTVNFYNWSNYIAPGVLDAFTKETGIKVVYDTFDANETLETRLLAGRSGYDLVVPSAYFLQRQIGAGIFQTLDKARLPNLANAWPQVTARLAIYDPGNAHAVNYMWGTTGIGINVDKVKERLGADAELNTWSIVFDPEKASKLADCGIYMLDTVDEILPAALNYLGLDPDSKDTEDFAKAEELLLTVRPFVKKFHSSEYINALANGDICMAVGWSGDILQARDRAAEAEQGVTVEYVIPKEGALMWFDNMAIPADAPHVEEALEFLNYIMKPEVIAKASNYVYYANGNAASKPFLNEDVIGDPAIYPDEDTVNRLYTTTPKDQRTQRSMTRLWTKVVTGQ